MASLSGLHIVLIALLAMAAAIAGWILRARRAALEKQAISAGWQHQVNAQQKEHDRLAAQNTGLMEQVSQAQAASQDARVRAKQLADDMRDTLTRQDALQRKIKGIRNDLENTLEQRDRLRSDAVTRSDRHDVVQASLREKDEKIARLKRELGRWQERVPPLVERFRERDQEANELEAQLGAANAHIAELEDKIGDDGTRIESMERTPLDNLDASNDQYDETLETEVLSQHLAAPCADRNEDRDDLQRIKGIGPAIEKMLHALSIVSFSQLADLSESDIDRIATELRGARTRIHREDWIGQASILQQQSPNNYL